MEVEKVLKVIYVYVKRVYEGKDVGKAFGIIMDFIHCLDNGVIEEIIKEVEDKKGETINSKKD